MEKWETYRADVLIIGGATAGCFAAISARKAGADVLVVDKSTSGYSGASIMACGFWTYFSDALGDDLNETMAYNNRNSCYLNNRDWSEKLLRESWGTVEDLYAYGCKLPAEKDKMQDYFLGELKESVDAAGGGPAHVKFEHVGTKGFGQCPTGYKQINPRLRAYCAEIGVRFIDRTMVTELIVEDGVCKGAVGFRQDDASPCVFLAKKTLLSAGKNTYKGPGMGVCMSTGDATAMAYRSGAELTGGEFPDMHTTLGLYPYWKSNGGEYATYQLYTRSGGDGVVPWRGFDLAMVSAFHDGQGPVYWDLSQATVADKAIWDRNQQRRNAPHECGRAGVSIHKGGRYNVAGGAVGGGCAEQSYGLWLNGFDCQTNIAGLYAAGDAACTWSWGAILDGPPPGLMPAGVTGKLAGAAMAERAAEEEMPSVSDAHLGKLVADMLQPLRRAGGFTADYATGELQHLMLPYYIIHIKHGARMQAALTMLDFHERHMCPRMMARDAHELRLVHEYRNMVCNAITQTTASLERKESRGWHYREDYPQRDDATQLSWITMHREGEKLVTGRVPVPEQWRPDAAKSEDELYGKMWLAWEHGEGEN